MLSNMVVNGRVELLTTKELNFKLNLTIQI